MKRKVKKYSYTLCLAFYLNACDGNALFRTKPCEDGTLRRGSACVAESNQGSGECKDPDLSDVRQGTQITMCDGSVGEGKLIAPADCSQDGEQNCVNKSNFVALDASKLDTNKIAKDFKIAGIVGTVRAHKQCRNYSALATFDSSYPPSNLGWNATTFAPAVVATASDQITFTNPHGLILNSPVRFSTTVTLPAPLLVGTTYYAIYISNTVIQVASVPNGSQIDITTQGTGTHTAHDVADSAAQYYDTMDDFNNNLSFSPANNPWNSNEYLCDATNFVNVTSTSAPLLPSGQTPSTANQAFTQIWQDQITGTYISNILFQGAGGNWSAAVRTCESLNGGTAGDGWHLPTQKELLQLYANGISKVTLAGGNSNSYFWSATAMSQALGLVWEIRLSDGATLNLGRGNANQSVICVR